MSERGSASGQTTRPPADGASASEHDPTAPSSATAMRESTAAVDVRAEASLEGLMEKINSHLRDHHTRTGEECQAVMSIVGGSLEGLMDKHFSLDADPARVSEMLLFHVMFSGQQYLECEHAQLVLGEGGARAVSYPVRKLCALLSLPRFASLQPRLVAHVGLLSSLWLPRDASVLVEFFQDAVELLQNLEGLWHIVEERGEANVLVAGTRVVAFSRLGKALGEAPLDIELPSRDHLSLCRASMTRIAAKVGALMPVTTTGAHALASLWSLLGRQLDTELRPETEAFHQVSLEALLALLEKPPPAGAMPQLGINCLRLAGRALAQPPVCGGRGAGEEQETGARVASNNGRGPTLLERLPAIQDLTTRCLRLIFPGSCRDPQTKKRTPKQTKVAGATAASAGGRKGRRRRVHTSSVTATLPSPLTTAATAVAGAAATICLSSLSDTLPCIVRWWTGCQRSASRGIDEVGTAGMNTEHAVALARAVAAAYASAVEGSRQRPAGRKVSSKAVAGIGAQRGATTKEKTPRRKSGADTPRGWDAGTPRFGAGLNNPRRTVAARRPAIGSAARPQVTKRFAAAVSALSAVPCVQPELMRTLRAVLNSFPRTPIAVLRRLGTEDQENQQVEAKAGENVREGAEGGGGGDMAPPPPRPPSGKKKRRVSLETGGLRTSDGGSSARRGDRRGSLLPGSGLQKRGRASPTTPAISAAKSKTAMKAPFAERSGSGWPPVFSGDSAAHEAVDIVLTRAKAALKFLDIVEIPAQEKISTDRGDAGDKPALAGVQAGKGATAAEIGSSGGRLHLLFQHTAAITCALRMFAPFVDAARHEARGNVVDAAERRLEFGGRCQSRRSLTPRVARSEKRGLGIRKNSNAGDGTWPRVISQLVEGFTVAVKTVVCYETERGTDFGGESKDSAAVDPSLPRATIPPEEVGGRLIAGLWDMLVSCAAELPALFLVRRPPRGGHKDGSGDGGGGGGESRSFRLGGTIGFVAEKSLQYILSPGCRDAGESREGSAVIGTVFGRAAASSPLPLKCFLLAAAASNKRVRDDGAGGSRQSDRAAQGVRKSHDDAAEEQRPKKRRTHSDIRTGGGGGDNGGKGDSDDVDGHVFDVEKAFLDGLRPDRSALVRQCAMAALPTLRLCCNDNGECLNNSTGGSGGGEHFTEHAATCNWKTRWIPALLTLCENHDHGGSQAVRVELAVGLLRLGASLDRSARRAESTTDEASAAGQQERSRHHHNSGGDKLRLGPLLDEAQAGPNVFVDMLPLWPSLLKDESVVVRAAAARSVLAAAAAAPLSRLRAAGAAGANVLRLLTDMLACGDPEVAWVVAGGAGQFVADGGKMLRAMYRYNTIGAAKEGIRSEGMDVEGAEEEGDEEDEDTCDAQEEQQREVRSRENALSKFINTIGKMLQEHEERLRLGRWQSLHEFTALLRALGSIGCESDPSDDLGRTVYLWTLIRLVDVWVDEGNECGPAAHEQIVRVCNHGKAPLPELLLLPPASASYLGGGGGRNRNRGTTMGAPVARVRAATSVVAGGRGGRPVPVGTAGLEMDSGSILAPLMEKLMETGHMEEFVEQALGSRNFRSFLEDSVAHVLPVFVAGSKAAAVEQLAALCDHFEVGDARGKDPPQRLLNRHLPHVLTDVLMRGRLAWTDEKSSPGLQFLLKYFPESTPKRLIEGVLPQILEQVSWQLCGPRREDATVALQAVAHISYQHAAAQKAEMNSDSNVEESAPSPPPVTGRKAKKKDGRGRDNQAAKAKATKAPVMAATVEEAEVSMERKVESMVTSQFLFLMSNVVSKRWSSRTTKDKIRAIQVLGRLVGFLSAEEAGGLFPKVMATLHSALADPHGTPAQRRTAYRVMMGYILGLSDASLAENLSTIVVNVLALIEEVKSDDGGDDVQRRGGNGGSVSARRPGVDDSTNATPPSAKMLARGRASHNKSSGVANTRSDADLLEEALAYSRAGAAAPSPVKVPVGNLRGGVLEKEKGAEEKAEIRATAAALLSLLIVEKQGKMRAHFHKIPFMPQLPDLPALGEVSAVLSEELGYQSLGEQLGRLTPLLKDESTEVRRAALKHLALVVRRDKQRLAELVLEGGGEVDPVVSRLLTGLLELSTDSDARIRDLCGICLGEVGAIDPARVGLRLGGRGEAGGGTSSSSGQALFEAAPWEITLEEMSLLLIRDLLVPAFRASTTSMEQDRVAFGIQELLHILSIGANGSAGGDKSSSLAGEAGAKSESRPAGGGIGGTAVGGPMPERLARRLREAQVLSVVEPFWTSTYKLSDRAPSSKDPFFYDRAMTVSLERWLSSWCRYLISRARGPLRPAFEACRGAVRAHAPMAQFLLTHLVADVLVFGDKEAGNQVLAEVLAVVCAASPASSSSFSSSTLPAARTPAASSATAPVAADTTAAATTSAAGASSSKLQRTGSRAGAGGKGGGLPLASRSSSRSLVATTANRSGGRAARGGSGTRRGDGVKNAHRRLVSPHAPCRDRIRGSRGGGGAGSVAGGGGGGSIQHIATQATFRLLDCLGHWAAGRKKRSGGAGAAGGTGWPDDSVRKAALLGFVGRVPKGVLVGASTRVRAYTRALRYLEEQIRAEHADRLRATGRRSATSLVGSFRNDGANGTLPVLNPAELHQLQAIYRTLSDEPDGMVGLDVMRGAAGVAATLKQRIWQYEHAEDWAGALEVYEQALQERELLNLGRRSPHLRHQGVGSSQTPRRRSHSNPMQDRYDQMAARTPKIAGNVEATQPVIDLARGADEGDKKDGGGDKVGKNGKGGEEEPGGREDKDFEGDAWEEGEVERGMLHALVELGNLEMLLHQAAGMLSVPSKHHLAPLLLPVAVEASWRLQRWPLLQDLLQRDKAGAGEFHGPSVVVRRGRPEMPPSLGIDESPGESRYRLALGKVMLRLEESRPAPFAAAITEARANVMAGLGAASMESYRRAYPFLLKLHSLREAEQAFEAMQREREPATRREALQGLGWEGRLSAMGASLRQLAPVLAVRRTAFELCSLEVPQSDNWLQLAKRARAAGQFAVAGAALRRAGRLGVCQDRLAFEEAKLAKEREGVHRALVILEPVETDVDSLKALLSHKGGNGGGDAHEEGSSSRRGLDIDGGERMQLARKLLLTTEWIVEAGQKHGQAVVARYKLALQLRPGWEKGFFCLGQYVDLLFKSRVDELQRLGSRSGGGSRINDGGGGGGKRKGNDKQQRHKGARGGWAGDELAHRLALQTMENYARSLRFGAKYIFQSMPRLLTLWFQVGFLRDPSLEEEKGKGSARLRSAGGKSANAKAVAATAKGKKRQAAQAKSIVRKLQSDSTELVKDAVRSIPPYMWYTALPQLTSRVGHPNEDVLKVIIDALAMLLKAHPKQALWHLSSLCLSINDTRRQVGKQVFEQARRLLDAEGREGDAVAVQDGQALFSELILLAEEQPPKYKKEANFKIGHRMDLHRFIVPVQAGLTVSLPQAPRKDATATAAAWSRGGGSGRAAAAAAAEASEEVPCSQAEVLAAATVAAHNPFPGGEMHIKCFNTRVTYMASKAKPKKVSLKALETGESVYFLCKQERNGDLRKDARLMEFNGMINRLLQQDPAGRARKLRLRTYAVICLNEECGVLEWVQDTSGFRNLVHKVIRTKGRSLTTPAVKPPPIGQLKSLLDRIQLKAAQPSGMPSALKMYRQNILDVQQPCFHLWFVDHFAEPTAWFEARTTFARSAAVWSSVGHVVGLGDRHGENILIHTESGECVHVDFDCLFDKGLTLARPEIVPFRLTPSMVGGMGLCGFEGVFRRVMETCMSVLRTNRETLLSVLEPFLQDPTVGWGRSGRAQRSTGGDSSDGELSGDDGDGGRGGGGGADLGRESENEDADRVLRVINERLQGRYNLAVPRPAGLGAADAGNDLPLSVQGQVHRLITEATSQENLCQMYIGWMPWM